MSELKHKVGDKVRIKSYDWFCNSPKDKDGDIELSSCYFVRKMSVYCGEIAIIKDIITTHSHGYKIDIDGGCYRWTDSMFDESYSEKLDLTKILKDCPKGTKLYSSLMGEVTLENINEGALFPICVETKSGNAYDFSAKGEFILKDSAECLLFPSKENRDWSTFKVPEKQEGKEMEDAQPKFKVGDILKDTEKGCIFFVIGIDKDGEYYHLVPKGILGMAREDTSYLAPYIVIRHFNCDTLQQASASEIAEAQRFFHNRNCHWSRNQGENGSLVHTL